MKPLVLFLSAVMFTGCATATKPSGLLGKWFDWRLGKELFILEADGTGAWKGSAYRQFTWVYDPKTKVVKITEMDRSAAELRLLYSESAGSLVSVDVGLNAERTRNDETPISPVVAINDLSKMGRSFDSK